MKRALLAFLIFAIEGTSCSQLMGTLRRDLDDTPPWDDTQPTVGGSWAEHGFLSESAPEGGDGQFATVGHSDRSPAGQGPAAHDNGNSWVSQDQRDSNMRDGERAADTRDGDEQNVVSFDNTPNLPPATKRLYKNGWRATAADFIDDSQNEGSLWASDGQTNYYFTKNKVRGVGDIVTVILENSLIRDMGTEVRRTLNDQERATEMALAGQRAQGRAAAAAANKQAGNGQDTVTTTQAAPTSASEGSASKETGPAVTPADLDVSKSLELKAGDPMMAEIIERYPNGNYKIRGIKRVLYKNGPPRLVNLVGVVRGSDIGEDDTVASGKLYEYRLEAVR